MKTQYFFLFPKIDQKKNGLVFALLKRAKILNEQLGISPTIITTEYDRSLAENYWSLIATNLAPPSIGYLNLYGYFQGTHLKLANKKIHDPMVEMFNSNILKTIIPFTYNQRFHDKNNNPVRDQICVNTTKDNVSDIHLGRGSLTFDWDNSSKDENGSLVLPKRKKELQESDFTELSFKKEIT